MTADTRYSLDEVADRLAIEQVIARYVHAIDARDYDALDDVFTTDAEFDLTAAGGIAGRWPEVKVYYSENLEAFVDYLHAFTNTRISFTADRASASTRSKVINPCGMVGSDGEIHHFLIVGAYDDEWSRTPAGWRISKRVWEHGWISGDYPSDQPPGQFEEQPH